MDLDNAEKTFDNNKHLIGTEYRGKQISTILILEKDASHNSISHAANVWVQVGIHSPDYRVADYDLYVIYDLPTWVNKPLEYTTLESLLFRLNKSS
ncbi:hypothetical protein SAMN05428975_3609 [Mucilaginibacter sp. OK268]|uniref:hypothetical protein n=1 Tax=Mucilaginibacter sp. OK268 TaxID=1881048 RepID=UPI00088CB613|nr:hypothetical protein [Mucilaginibacter sp. OK268]SDP91896.1 hypothetical protein SAMN05428975_3609 [Mucilaginibacter sp. OK268]